MRVETMYNPRWMTRTDLLVIDVQHYQAPHSLTALHDVLLPFQNAAQIDKIVLVLKQYTWTIACADILGGLPNLRKIILAYEVERDVIPWGT